MGLHEHQHAHEALHARDNDIFHKLHIGSEGTGLDNKLRFIHHGGKGGHKIDNKLKYINKAVGGVGKNAAPTVKTVYSQVYVTESKTFNGPAQYVTETAQAATPAAASPTTSATLDAAQQSYANAKSLANSPHHASSSSPSSIEPASTPTQTHAKGKPIQHTRSSASAAASSSSKATGRAKGTPLSNSRTGKPVVGKPLSASHTANVISQKSTGMSGGAKAGLAFGIIIAIALAAGLVYFCWRRKKNQNNGEKLDEKHASKNSFFGGTSAAFGAASGNLRRSVASDKSFNNTSSAATAPRLSLRPVTQFLPNMIGGMGGANKNNDSLNVPPMSEKPRSGWERPAHNPFGDAAAISEKQARPESPPSNPFEENAANEPGTPTSTTFGTAAAVPVNGNAKGASNIVHRVQLDFKPSMDDELELRSGQLVRMLHEYDDGWALCTRMDRSQQGVCPRTCLSKLPVKKGPPPGPNGRPAGPPPSGMRGPPPAGMVPRPLTPTGRERSQTLGRNSPAPQEKARVRSMSAGSADRPVSPIARKPVPGMAM